MHQPAHRKKPAFTLIEVLVVVSIVALLASVLLPALSAARNQVKEVRCRSQVRQLGVGMMMYIHQYGMFPGHQWILFPSGPSGPELRIRWFNAMARMLAGFKVQNCPSVGDWEVGRNNSYGYNYKYLGSARDSLAGPKRPFESFLVKSLRQPAMTIAFGDSDGTGWTNPHRNGVNDPEMLGNHGYTLDPTYIPTLSLEAYSGGELEPYAWKWRRTYISDRHRGGSSACYADGHAERIIPRTVYRDNRFWNGLGGEDPTRDHHVSYRLKEGSTPSFRYELSY